MLHFQSERFYCLMPKRKVHERFNKSVTYLYFCYTEANRRYREAIQCKKDGYSNKLYWMCMDFAYDMINNAVIKINIMLKDCIDDKAKAEALEIMEILTEIFQRSFTEDPEDNREALEDFGRVKDYILTRSNKIVLTYKQPDFYNAQSEIICNDIV